MKKRILLVVQALVIGSLLIGCSSSTSSKEESKELKSSDEAVKVDTTELLPIGTVMKLKNVDKAVMVYGQYQKNVSNNITYDYIAVPYPEGNVSSDYNMFFNRNQIEKVLHVGYVTPESRKLLKNVQQQIDGTKSK
ncbi:DUF4176 domain-containing protein [Priestia sp. 179-F W1.4 NHS]|uniref:DUF4176 domain-containing protein n=1 Tax=Priestia sp. 179-F W1.4 NHS TaxID=3374296 RepID=UPI00387A09B4